MLELARTEMTVARCFDRPEVLDALPEISGVHACRVAPDELLLIGAVAAVDLPAGLVVDETGGWSVWTISGSEAGEAFARLSAIPLRPGFLQGLIGSVPGKAVVLGDRIHLLVASSVSHHLEARIRAACADLLPAEADDR